MPKKLRSGLERAAHLGGKIGAWPHRLADGTAVPAGWYDRRSGRWVPGKNGRVIKADLLVAEYVARGELKLILEDYVVPGPPISLVYPSAGHQLAKVRVFSDFAADLLLRWNEEVRRWIKQPSRLPSPLPSPLVRPPVR